MTDLVHEEVRRCCEGCKLDDPSQMHQRLYDEKAGRNIVQSLNSPFFPPHIGAEPGRAKEESRITCMRMLRTPPFSPPNGHSRPQSPSLLRMTDREKGSGEPLDQALSLFVLGWNKESASDWSNCDAVKFERASRRSSRPLGNSVCFLCKSHIVHAIVKCAVFGGFSVWKRLQKSRTFLLSSL